MSKKIKVGLVQMHCTADQANNISRAAKHIKALAKRGAQIICLPELFASQYFCQTKDRSFFKYAEPVPGGAMGKALQTAAKAAGATVITSVYERDAKKLYNTGVVINEAGKFVGKYRKMHIPDDLEHYYGEAYYFAKGNLGFKAFKTKHAVVGPMICWDQWFPEGARIAAVKGAQILFYPTAIGFQRQDPAGLNEPERQAWITIQRAHAIANNVFVVAVNRVGIDQHLNFWGSSFVADPYGRILAQAPINKEADLVVSCDLSLIPEMRRDWPFLANRRVKL